MEKTEMKKVLVLGGSNRMVKMVESLKMTGIYSIVADAAINAPAKDCADRAYNVSPSNIKSLKDIGEAEKLDGIYAPLGDITTWNALALCKRLNVPFYLKKEQWGSSVIEAKFNDYCRTFNVSVIDESAFFERLEETAGNALEFPIILSSYDKSVYAVN